MKLLLRGLSLTVVAVGLAACPQESQDTTPEPFFFPSRVGAVAGALVTSDSITVTGIDAPARASASGGEIIINGQVVTAAIVRDGDRVAVRAIASSEEGGRIEVTVSIGGVSASFAVFTRGNHAPRADERLIDVTQEVAYGLRLSGSDLDGDPLSFALVTTPRQGDLSGTPPRLVYRAREGATGSDGFAFTVSDGRSLSAEARVSINIRAGSVIYVGPDGGDANNGHAPDRAKRTLASALEAAVGQYRVVRLAAGSYQEQVVIARDVDLRGDGAGTVVKAPALLEADGGGARALIAVTGGSVTIRDLTVSGPAACEAMDYGILVTGGATLDIADSTLDKLGNGNYPVQCEAVALRVGDDGRGESGHLTASNVTVSDYARGGIVVDGAGSSASITGSTISGIGPQAGAAQNGIQVSRGASATIRGNTISANACDYESCGEDLATQEQSVGVMLYASGDATVDGNRINGNDLAVLANPLAGHAVTVSNNDLGANRYYGLVRNPEDGPGGSVVAENNSFMGTPHPVADLP